ncbi:MAG: hypothetical protein LBJ36_01755 [Synergistaceae bacterium]|jgi:hypothetical protein|nr:hypothetical protein [Synergistaceae bacterium]
MSVFTLCERAIGLVRGKRLELTTGETAALESLNYSSLISSGAQEEAVTCCRHFAAVRDSLFHTYPWVFAMKAVAISTLTTAAVLRGWKHGYNLPTDCLMPLRVMLGHKATSPYEQVGNVLLCDRNDGTLRYIRSVPTTEGTNSWPPLFQDAFCARLAGEIAVAVTGTGELAEYLMSQYNLAISEAHRQKVIDADISMDNYGRGVTSSTTRYYPASTIVSSPSPRSGNESQ